MPPIELRITILDCDTPVPNVYAERGLYSEIFAALLRDAAGKTPGVPELNLLFRKYDCLLGHFPSQEELLETDGVIITGSAASAYDPAPWITALTEFTNDLYTCHPQIRIFGSCFGHQVLCNALFSSSQGDPVVTRDPAGWELGIHPITLSSPFLSHYGPVLTNALSPSQARLQFVHSDHVVLSPSQLRSKGLKSIGRSEHCALQGVWKKGRLLTYQGHAEFDEFVNAETVKVFGKPIWTEDVLESALRACEGADDGVWAAGVMLRFFLEDAFEDEVVKKGEVSAVHEEDLMARL